MTAIEVIGKLETETVELSARIRNLQGMVGKLRQDHNADTLRLKKATEQKAADDKLFDEAVAVLLGYRSEIAEKDERLKQAAHLLSPHYFPDTAAGLADAIARAKPAPSFVGRGSAIMRGKI